MAAAASRTVRVTCTHDCPDACSALVDVDEHGRATDVRADSSHPVTGRHLCVKVDRYLERVYSPNRIMTPLRRTGPKGSGEFAPIGWDEALDEISTRWKEIIAADGPTALLGYSYLGSMGMLDAFGTTQALFNRLGATRLERSICGPQVFALTGITGVQWTDSENLPDARTIVVWGMDPLSTSIHTWELIRKARKNGAMLIVVDPYRSRTAARADIHVRPHPGTDGAVALAIGHVIVRDGLDDHDYVAAHTTDVEAYREAVADWTPERAEAESGVPASVIVEVAHRYATERPAVFRIGVGMQRATGAGTALRAIQCLTAITGQWQWAAGGIAQSVSIGEFALDKLSRPDLCPPGTREINMIQLGRALTDTTMDPPIRGLYVWNSNPAVIAADQQRVWRGLARDDLFTVVHDQFVTDTARYADIVLPATTMFEHADLVGSWGYSYLSWNEAVIDPIGESKSNAEVTRLLAARMGFDDDVFSLDDHQLMELALDGSPAARAGVTAATLRDEGFVRVGTPVGEAASADATFAFRSPALGHFGLDPVAAYLPPASVPSAASPYPLRLLTLKRHYSINSSYGSLPVLLNAEPIASCELHPDDAAARGIADGDAVAVFNDLGRVQLQAAVTDAVPAGTVAVPFGRWGNDPAAGGANSLTSDRLGDLANGPTFCDNLVEVTRS
ncbi:MAG TPA: molybdopterin-dependent oxidoreductase [Ilumatobacteraceae bacterium]|nr:molybdopterin-dependent oxidoreductase [Ilumatobacteraceae bacterium]